MGLAENKCVPCRGDVPPMERATAEEIMKRLETKKGSCATPFQIAQLFRAIAVTERVLLVN